MAKGQIHMGKNGPEKCSVDSSKPRSRGCPYEATGHYSSAEEAMESYAKLNRVDPAELNELVADGASPKDAVGLIRSGYGRDYLVAAKKDIDRGAPEPSLEDARTDYLEAKTQLTLALQEIAPDAIVEPFDHEGRKALLVSSETDDFSFTVDRGEDRVVKIYGFASTESSSQRAKLRVLELRDDVNRMLDGYEKIREGEPAPEA